MHISHFTLEDASEICEDFEDLIDTEFRHNGSDILVDKVVVTPYAEKGKADFLAALAGSGDAAALLAEFETEGYDVIIVASADDGARYYIPVTRYVEENGINYNFPSGSD